MIPPVKPAMTAERWAHDEMSAEVGENTLFAYVSRDGHRFAPGVMALGWNGDQMNPLDTRARHALAALALHGQDFGFTWEDVDMLRDCSGWMDLGEPWPKEASALRDLADRIAALLPPREP